MSGDGFSWEHRAAEDAASDPRDVMRDDADAALAELRDVLATMERANERLTRERDEARALLRATMDSVYLPHSVAAMKARTDARAKMRVWDREGQS